MGCEALLAVASGELGTAWTAGRGVKWRRISKSVRAIAPASGFSLNGNNDLVAVRAALEIAKGCQDLKPGDLKNLFS
jgi:hypothetical protein